MVIWDIKIIFEEFFCVFLPPLLNNFYFIRSIPFLSFIVPIFTWKIPKVSLIFLKRSLVFFYYFPLFLCIVHLGRCSYLSLLFFGTLHSDIYIWMQIYRFFFSLSFAFCFSSFLSYLKGLLLRQPFCFLHFFSWRWFWLQPPVECFDPPSKVLQALYQI